MKEIITDSEGFNFESHINKLANNDILFIVMQEFAKVDLHPSTVSNLEMGYIFEEVIRRFSESHNEDAGQHYTPREVIRLMVNILFSEDRKILTAGLSNIKIFENGGIKIDHMEDFLNIINVYWNEDDYYSYFREIGTKIRVRFE